MSWLPALPLLIPLATAAAALAVRGSHRVQFWLSLSGAAALLIAAASLLGSVAISGIHTIQVGGWPAPFGISIVADSFSAIMTLSASVIALLVIAYSRSSLEPRYTHFGFHSFVHVLLAGVCGAFLTGDLFNLYVWFEVMLIASFALMALGGTRAQLEGAIKYVALGLISSTLLLASVGILYGMTGTLNMADLHVRLGELRHAGIVSAVALLFLSAVGIKAAVFPLFFWLPASYHTPPPVISALFSALLTKVGVYVIIRAFTLLFGSHVGYVHEVILVVAGFTMVTGVLGAVAQHEFNRILSFHIISQIGYMLIGVGLLDERALTASIFFIVHNMMAKTALFLVSGAVDKLEGTQVLEQLGGFYARRPGLALLFLLPALSLAGMPPLSGFVGKLALVQATLELESYAIGAAALGVSLLTLFSMTKIWAAVFWSPASPEARSERERASGAALSPVPGGMIAGMTGLAALTVLLGVVPAPLLSLSAGAASELMQPAAYVEAVLGSVP